MRLGLPHRRQSRGIRPIASKPHRLPSDRADEVERKLRARADQIERIERLKSPATALGLCHACGKVVYARDGLAMAGIYLFHGDCGPSAVG